MYTKKKLLCLVLSLLLLIPTGVFVGNALRSGGTVTRAQWITALVDTFEMTVEEDNYPDNYYSDISEQDTYYRDIMVAVEFGVIDLEAGLPFAPNDPATREFAAHTLNFCLGFQLDEGASYTFAEADSVTYPDDIQIAINRNWFSLNGAKFLPEQPVTAAQKDKMLQDAKAILASDQLAEDYANAYQFAEGVKVLPEDTVFTQTSDAVYIISAPAKAIAKNDLFVLFDNDLPVVYKATAVSVSGQDYTVTVAPQNINNYLLSIDAQGSTVGDLKEFIPSNELDTLYVLEDGTRVKDVRAAGTQKIKSVYFSQTFGDLSVAIEMYDMKLNWQAKGNIMDRSSLKVKAIVTGKTFCNASLAFGASASDFVGNLTLGTYPIGSLGVVTVTANVSVDGSITISYGANFSTGVTYTYADGFRIPQTFKKTHFSLFAEATLDISVTARASITGIPMVSANCYATVGMKAYFAVRSRGLDKTPAYCFHTDAWLYAKIGAAASVGFESKVFGADTFKKSWSVDVPIWDRNTSPARSVTHFEDGKKVESCYYGETNFFGYNSFYWSKLGSRYGNGGMGAVRNEPIYEYTTDAEGNATITRYIGSFSAISIPTTIDDHKVIAIGENVFKNHDELITVTLPASVTRLGNSAFADCDGLREINFPQGLKVIENYAFSNAKNLLRAILPDSMETLGIGAFRGCSALQVVRVPKEMWTAEHCGANYMYPAPFTDCKNLTQIIFAEGITRIPNALFDTCSGLRSVTLPETVTQLHWKAFAGCRNLTEVVLPASLTHIDSNVFLNCSALKDVTLPAGLQVLGCGAFENCTALTKINIPKDMWTGEHCGNNAYPGPFKNCSSLNEIVFAKGITRIPDALFDTCSGLRSVTLPETVTRLHWKAFAGCKNLTEVVLPAGMTEIDSCSFLNCSGLTQMQLPAGMQVLGCSAFENCTALKKINIPKNMRTGDYCGNNAYPGPFKNCSSLSEVTFDAGITRIPDAMFWQCNGLQELVLPEGITELSFAAFRASSLKKITLPATLKTLGSRAFHNSALEEITIPDSVTSVGDHVLADCYSLQKANWPAGTTTMPDYAFAGSEKLQTVILPDTITTLHRGVFRSCKSLVMETLPESVTKIGVELFFDCDALKTFTIPSNIDTLSNSFFENCDALVEVTIPENIITLGNNVFYDCDALTGVTMSDQVRSMGNAVFRYCDVLKNVRLSQRLTVLPADTFRDCPQLEQVVVPYMVTSIGNNAFSSSPMLKKAVIGERVKSIGSGALPYATTTVIYGITGSYAETFAKENGFQFVENTTAATAVTLPANKVEMNKGTTAQLIVSIAPVDFGGKVVFKSNKTDVVTVSETGELKAVGVGTATIKITAGSVSASCTVTVQQPITRITLNKTNLSLQLPATYQLVATVSPSDASNTALLWSSSNEKAATVDQNGLVTAVGNGTAVITAAAQDGSGKTVSCNVSVTDPNNIPVSKLTLDKTSVKLMGLEALQLKATLSPANAANKKLLWTSSDESVATVDENGTVSALKKGTTTITVTAADGYGAAASCTVEVTSDGHIVADMAALESAHNYPVDCTDAWKYTLPGSMGLMITFDQRTNIEDGFDYLHIYDGAGKLVGTYTGTALAGQTVTVIGDTVIIRLQSDDSGTEWGFKVTNVEEVQGIPGDLDGNIAVNEDDVIYLLQHLLMPEDFPVDQVVDYDKNDLVDEDDVIYLLQHLLMPEDFPL